MKALLIVALSCLIVGIIICVTALALGEFDMEIFSAKYIEGTETLAGEFTDISVDTGEFDVQILPAEDGVCRAEYRQNSKTPLRFAVENGTLTVHAENLRKWYDYIAFFNFRHSELTLYLPARMYGTVQIDTATGTIGLPGGFTATDMRLHTSTGNITLNGVSAANALEVKASTGYVKLTDISAAALSARAGTGRLNLQYISVARQLDVRATTGEVKLVNATAPVITVETSTGNIVLQDTVSTGTMTLKASTGEVRLTACDAKSMDITTSTGDVRGTLRSPKIFIASTSTGRVSVPDTATGGTCHITCTTGDIDIQIQ